MIKKITIRDVASYDHEGCTFEDLQKVNFIYGGNGCGKTTLSRLLGSSDAAFYTYYAGCDLDWDTESVEVLVYNKDFRERNLGEYIPGIFTLGENATEAELEMEKLQAEQNKMLRRAGEAKKVQDEYKQMIEEKRTELEERIKASVYEKYRRKYGRCLKEHTTATKAVKGIIAGITEGGWMHTYPPSGYHTEKDIKEKYSLLYGDMWLGSVKKLYEFDSSLDKIVEISEDPIWAQRIVGSEDEGLGTLIEERGIADWVRQGQEILKANGEWQKIDRGHAAMCPFCQEHTISKAFKNELETYYDEEYEKLAARIKELENSNAKLVQEVFQALDEMEKQAKDDGLDERNLIEMNVFENNVQRLRDTIWANTILIQSKRSEPGREIEMRSVRGASEVLKLQIQEANKAIVAYNRVIENQEEERRTMFGAIWNMMIFSAIDDVKSANKEIRAKEKLRKKWQKEHEDAMEEYERLGRQIREKHEGIISMQPTVDWINNTLSQFGFSGFRLQASPKKEHHYQIERPDGSLANETLSEGEVTFITFLYFMQKVKGIDVNLAKREPIVVVIDDPISSLDDDAIDLVSTLTNDLKEDARNGSNMIEQLIVLTHNKAYHKLISERQKRKDTHYWKLIKKNGVSNAEDHGMVNPVNGEYEDLWCNLREERQAGNMRGLQNLMRRIVENYFVGFGGYEKNKLFKGDYLKDSNDKLIVVSLAKWMDEGSHGVTGDLSRGNSEEKVEMYFEWFRQLFIKMGHEAHYKMMMKEK